MNTDFSKYLSDEHSQRCVTEASDIPHSRNRNSDPVVTFEGKRLHSAVDPKREANDWIHAHADRIIEGLRENDQVVILLLGPGLGYGIAAIERTVQENAIDVDRLTLHCVEASPEIARKALSLHVWEPSQLQVRWSIIDGSARLDDLYPAGANVLTLTGAAGYQIRKSAYEDFLRISASSKTMNGKLRVLVPTPLYGGSLPAAYHSADALRELGYDVELLDLSEHFQHYQGVEKLTGNELHRKSLRGLYANFLAESIVARAIEWKADVVWAVAQTPLTPAALRELRHLGIRTAFWFVEDFRLFDYWKDVCLEYDAIFTIQNGEFHQQLRALGVKNVMYLPCAVNPQVHYRESLSADEKTRYGSALSFVGAGYQNRQIVFSRMSNTDLKLWGNDWPQSMVESGLVQEGGRRVTTDETRKIFNASDININLHSSPYHNEVNTAGDFVNPRTFEIAACGGFQLVDSRSLLAELFAADELVTFSSVDELCRLIEKYQSDEPGRQLYAERARTRVLRDHTYTRRLDDAMRFMQSAFPTLKRKAETSFVDSLIEAVADDAEMIAYLDMLDRNKVIDLDSACATIQLGKGKLTRPEGIMLLMKEFRDWGVEKGVIA